MVITSDKSKESQNAAASRSSARGSVFATWQPRYAEHKIATFPVTAEKTPATKGYLRTGIRGSTELAQKFMDADALGFACGPSSKVTLVDVDSEDEKVLADVLATYGETPVISRTPSGGYHAWYRHNGERRQIRPIEGVPMDILGGGYAVAPPSRVAKGTYEFIRGELADLDHLKPMAGIETSVVTPLPAKWTGMRQGDGRNRALWERCMRAGAGYGPEQMIALGRSANQSFREPLMDAEVIKIATSAWQHDAAGLNFFTRPRVMLDHDVIDNAPDDAILLLIRLERYHGGNDNFILSKTMAASMGWGWPRWYAARDTLERLGVIRLPTNLPGTSAMAVTLPGLWTVILQSRNRLGG
jgi:bifunctional DNA primase/polymerase-like protein